LLIARLHGVGGSNTAAGFLFASWTCCFEAEREKGREAAAIDMPSVFLLCFGALMAG